MNIADSQKQIKLSFRTHLFTMMRETLSGIILSINFHLILSSSQHQKLLCLILYFAERKEENVENAETAETAEGPAPAPVSAPTATLEIVHE